MEVPVITSPISGIPEIIRHRETGLLVEPENIDELASSIEELLNNKKLRATIKRNGLQTVQQQFSNESNLRLLNLLLKKSVSGEKIIDISKEIKLGQI